MSQKENIKSVISVKENVETMKEEAEQQINLFAISFDSLENLKTFTEPIPKTIEKFELLPEYLDKSSDEVVGLKLSENLDSLIAVIGQEFGTAIRRNLNFAECKRRCIEERLNMDSKSEILQALIEEELVKPDREYFTLKMNRAIRKNTLELKGNLPKLSPTSTMEQIIEVKMAEVQLEDNIQSMIKETTEEFDDEYVEKQERYEKLMKERSTASVTLRKFKRQKSQYVMGETVFGTYDYARTAIVGRIKVVIKRFSTLSKVLTTTVRVRATGEEIVDPTGETQSLTGIVEILFQRYRKRGFVTITTDLMGLMSIEFSRLMSDEEPWKGFEDVERMLADWRKKELFKKLTEDYLFTSAYLKALHPESKFRMTLLTEVSKYIRDLKETDYEDPNSLPIFNHIKKVLEEERVNRGFAKIKSSGAVSNTSAASSGTAPPRRGNVQFAAAAEDGKLFADEVLKTQGVKVTDKKGKIYGYVAVRKLCAKCFPQSGAPIPCEIAGADKKCYNIQCNKCKFYGHRGSTCMQGIHAETGEQVRHD